MKDLILDTTFDLSFENGDFVIDESTEQHQELLLITNKGDWREDATIAVGVKRWLKDEDDGGDLTGEIKKEFEKDGMRVQSIRLDDEGFKINAPYK
jgi:hypothetical protein